MVNEFSINYLDNTSYSKFIAYEVICELVIIENLKIFIYLIKSNLCT